MSYINETLANLREFKRNYDSLLSRLENDGPNEKLASELLTVTRNLLLLRGLGSSVYRDEVEKIEEIFTKPKANEIATVDVLEIAETVDEHVVTDPVIKPISVPLESNDRNLVQFGEIVLDYTGEAWTRDSSDPEVDMWRSLTSGYTISGEFMSILVTRIQFTNDPR